MKDHLSREEDKNAFERKLNAVYFREQSYDETRQELEATQEQLDTNGYTEATTSLVEGTLTLHRLGVHMNLCACLRTINIMESLNATVKERCRKIRRWNNSEQCHRWITLGLLEVETKVKDIHMKEDLNKLQKALREQTSK